MTSRNWFEPLALDDDAERPLLPVKGSGLVFSLAVTGGVAMAMLRRPHSTDLVAIGIGMIVLALTWRSRRPTAVAGYWIVQTLAAAWVTVASHGHGALVALPIVAQTAFVTPRRFVVGFAVAQVALVVAATCLRAPSFPAAVGLASGHVAGIVFVVSFVELLVRERQGRLTNERLVVELATARERTRIARDVHDILGHSLTAVHAQLSGALAVAEHDRDQATKLVRSAQTLTERGLQDVRRSVGALRGERVALVVELRTLLDTAEQSGLRTSLHVEGAPRELPEANAVALRHAAQECITNCLRHGGATKIGVTVCYGERAVDLEIADDGRGAVDPEPGHGLRGLRERVELVGGTLVDIATAPGEGFALRARVPST